MNLSATLSGSGGEISASLGAGSFVLNGYTLVFSEIPNGHRLSFSRGESNEYIDILHGDAGRGIAGAAFNEDYSLTLTFTDGQSFTTPPLRGEKASLLWEDLIGKPAAYPPEAHAHEMGDISGLEGELSKLNCAALGMSEEYAPYHLGFYIDEDGDLCQTEEI